MNRYKNIIRSVWINSKETSNIRVIDLHHLLTSLKEVKTDEQITELNGRWFMLSHDNLAKA
jgi:hypothetical protein